jgi:hypothetical protein
MFLSTAHIAQDMQQKWQTHLSYAGLIVVLGTLLSKTCTFLTPALQGHSIGTINIFPLLLAACVAFVCVLAVRIVHWPGTATMTVLVFVAVYLLVSAFVPPMMKLLVQIEHQMYLPRAARLGSHVVSIAGQTPLILLTGLSIDGITWFGKRAKWSLLKLHWGIAIAAAVSAAIASALTLIVIGIALARGQATSHGGITFLLSLVLAVLGGLLASWLAIAVSKTLQDLRR